MFQYALGRHISLKNNEKLYLDLSGLSSSKEKKTTQRDCDLFHFSIKAQNLEKDNVDFAYTIPSLLRFYVKKMFGIYPYRIIQERGIWDILMDKFGRYSGWFNFDQEKLAIKQNTYLIGFRQSYKYFEDIRDVILQDFKPINPINNKNSDFLLSIREKITVSIHVRRGDYDDLYH